MNPDQMRARSREKIAQITTLAKQLQVVFKAKQHVDQDGFIENTVIFVDNENYPQEETPAPAEAPKPEEDAVL